MRTRDLETRPYTADERRVVAFLKVQVAGGVEASLQAEWLDEVEDEYHDDPIGFVLRLASKALDWAEATAAGVEGEIDDIIAKEVHQRLGRDRRRT